MFLRRFAALGIALLVASLATSSTPRALGGGSVSLTALDAPSAHDFNGLASAAGTAHTALPAGWFLGESGTSTRNNDAYAVDAGGGNAGDVYSYGEAGSADRAFGTLRSGTLVPSLGAAFTNGTGSTITSLDVSYAGEEWRLGVTDRNASDRLDFQYSLDATSLTAGTWVDVDALDFSTPAAGTTGTAGARDGNNGSFRTVVAGTIGGLAIAPNATVWVRWTDFDVASSDDGLAVDDFSITPHGGGAPTLSIDDVSVTEGNSGTMNATFTVAVSSPAHGGVTFDIATADGTGPLAATAADGDYVARAESAQTIPAGATAYSFAVAVNGDVAVEADETFVVNLSNVSGAALGDGQGTGQIVNDDEPPDVDTGVVISQVYGGGGNSGATFTHDFVELFNRGSVPVSLAGWSVQYTSAAGAGTWFVTPLTGSIAPGGYYLVRQAAQGGAASPLPGHDASGTINLGSTAGKVALQVTTDPIAGVCPSGANADLVGYGGTATCFEGTAPTAPPSNSTAALRKRGGCFDSDNNNVDFTAGPPTPRNSASPARSCAFAPAAIHDIQGVGAASPFAGQDVITGGVVTAVKPNGFFLQTPDGASDGNPQTSQGVFVFTSAVPAVAVGNEVSARGTVTEFFTLTQIESSLPGDVTVTGAGGVPAAATLTPAILDPLGPVDQLERFEGMRVEAASLTSAAPTNQFGEIAAVLTGVTRPMREPGISVLETVPPDPTTGTPDCCIPRFDENPERIWIDTDGLAGASALQVTSNVLLTGVSGPLDFTFGAYKILPEAVPAAGGNMAGVPVPAPAADEFTVAGFNIENFAGNETRRKKAALAIRQLLQSPDVIGHIEILDEATLQSLADQVNADAVAAGDPDPGYAARLVPAAIDHDSDPSTPPVISTQNVGFLVKTSRLRIDGVTQERTGETFVNPNNGRSETLHDRPPLVLRATVDPGGLDPRPVIVVVNHLRSFIDVEPPTGEGPRVRAKRKAQAESVAGLLQELQALNPGVPVISVGDYNAFQFSDGYTDPIATLKGAPTPDDQIVVDESPDLVNPDYVNLTDALPPLQRYSFIFEGTPQALDHVLVNTVAASLNTRYAIARGNADFPAHPSAGFAEDAARPERASDHDMPVAYFRFPPPSTDLSLALTADPAVAQAGAVVTYTFTVTNGGTVPAQNVVVTSNGATVGTFPLIAAGATQTGAFTAPASCAVPNGSLAVTTASVTSDTGDSNPANNPAAASVMVANAPPTIANVSASRTRLLLPLHQMVPVRINYQASDTCGAVASTLSVTSDEPVTGPLLQQGLAGLTSPDWQVVDARNVRLRAEASLSGNGRVYTITISARDEAGQTTTRQVTVRVDNPWD